MLTIKEQKMLINYSDDERNLIIGEIFVDDVSELPTADGIDGYKLVQGSIAYVIHSGELYVMDGNGAWYNSEDSSTPTTQETTTPDEPTTQSELQAEAKPVELSGENTEEGDSNDEST